MKIIDYVILGILGISAMIGVYQGFVVAVLNIASFFISWLTAFLFYPNVSRYLEAKTKLVSTLLYYTEGATKIQDIELRRTNIQSISEETLKNIIDHANLPSPFDTLIQDNIAKQAFNPINVVSLGDYFNHTITNIIVNIISFMIVYFAVRILLNIIISLVNHIVKLPVLKTFDSLLGGCFGLFRGIFVVFLIFALVPILLTILPSDFITPFLDESLFASFFYKSNIITSIIRGVI